MSEDEGEFSGSEAIPAPEGNERGGSVEPLDTAPKIHSPVSGTSTGRRPMFYVNGHARRNIALRDAHTHEYLSGTFTTDHNGAWTHYVNKDLPLGANDVIAELWNDGAWFMGTTIVRVHVTAGLGDAENNDDAFEVSEPIAVPDSEGDRSNVALGYTRPFFLYDQQGSKVELRPTFRVGGHARSRLWIVDAHTGDAVSWYQETGNSGETNLILKKDLALGVNDLMVVLNGHDNNSWHMYSKALRVVVLPRPVITPKNITSYPTTISGTGGVEEAEIVLCKPGGSPVYGTGTVKRGGSWDVTVSNLPQGTIQITGRQRFPNVRFVSETYSEWATAVEFVVPMPAVITSPEMNDVLRELRPEVSGTGSNGTTVTVFRQGGDGRSYGSGPVINGNWKVKLNENLPLGSFVFHAETKIGTQSVGWSNPVSVTVLLAIPVITGPGAGSEQNQTFTISGTGGEVGATVEILKDLGGHTVIGTGPVIAGGSWDATVTDTLPPGPVSLVAEQFIGSSEHSGRSSPRSFKIRPPALTAVSITFPTETSVKFSGTGHTDATVEITVVSGPGGTAPPPALVTSGKWETTATNWKFGEYSLKAIQKVSDNANGWIESQPYTFSASKVFPDPTDVTYTTDYQPTFSGKGLVGATVKLLTSINGPAIAPDAHVSNGVWSSKASAEWGPTLNREIFIKQYLNGQESPNWVKPKVTIAPLAPVVNAPVENGLSPKFSGTCWTNAVVELTFSGSTTKWPATVTGTSWTFQRETPFAPDVTHTVSVTQTAAQQASPQASKTFVVYAPIPKPVITVPEPGSEVGRDMTVQGTSGMKGATMQLRDAQFGRDLGEPKLLTVDGGWSIDLIGLGFRQYIIEAKQVRNQRPSEPSEPRTFDVVLLPPVITLPIENGDLPRTSTLLGTAMPGGRVTVWREDVAEPLCENIPVDTGGRWKAEVTLPVGVKTIRARQTFEKQTSKDSPPRRYNVVPAAPLIETPATGEHIGRRVVVSGFGVPGDTVTVKLGNATHTVLGRSPVLEDRTWSVAVEFDQPGGRYGLVAVASCDGFDSSDSPGRPVVLGTYWPVIESPAAGRWVSNPIEFKGQGRQGVGQVVSWFNPDQVWAPDLPVTGGRWQGEARQSLPQGGQWCRLKQSITDSTDGATVSDWVDSQRFEVPPLSAES